MINMSAKVSGRIDRFSVIHKDGTASEYGGFDNIILNNFFTRTDTSPFSTIHIGTGTVSPTATDTALTSKVATKSCSATVEARTVNGGFVTIPIKHTATFAVGEINAILGEVGLGPSTTALSTKALIKDGSGNAITVPVTVDDQLIIEYTLNFTFDCNTKVETKNIDGISTQVTTTYGGFNLNAIAYLYSSSIYRNLSYIPQSRSAIFTSKNKYPGFGKPTNPLNTFSGSYQTESMYKSLSYSSLASASSLSCALTAALNGSDNLTNNEPIDLIGISTESSSSYRQATYWHTALEFNPPLAKTSLKALTLTYNIVWTQGS